METIRKIFMVISILVIIAGLIFTGYTGYIYYRERKNKNIEKSKELEIVELLQKQEGTILTLRTEIAKIEKKIVTDTLKEKTVIKEEAPTYEAKKEKIIKLKENPEENAEKIEVARAEFEERINEFQASPDKILINTGEDKIVIYEDDQGNLVSLESGVTITRHRKAKEVINELKAGAPIQKEVDKKYAMAFSMVYDLEDKGYSPGLSYQLWDWKNLSLNITGYDFSSIKAGLDLCYNINKNIVIGIGARIFTLEDYEFSFDKYYIKAGVEFEF